MLPPEELRLASEGLFAKLPHRQRESEGGIVLAITSPHTGAGVSTIAKALVETIAESGHEAILADCRRPKIGPVNGNGASAEAGNKRNLWQLARGHEAGRLNPSHAELAKAIDSLRSQYHYVVIDCPSISESNDAASLAQLVDGFVFVVESNRTQMTEIAHAERTIEAAGGHIFGHVLNKRSFVVPDWLYRRMQAMGV